MRKKLFCKLFLGYLFISSSLNAQEKTLDCEYNMREAVFYLTEGKLKDSQKAIDYLKPCVKAEFADAQLLMGRIYLESDNEKDLKKGFKLIQKAAKQNNSAAACDLAILYKYGTGCNLNLNKAIKWFKKADKLGSDKARYSLGYLYYKGLGSIEQDYAAAVKWFKKSDYPMAKYWLGVCYYQGYGVTQNLNKAQKLLNSEALKNDDKKENLEQTNSKEDEEATALINQSTITTESDKTADTSITIQEFSPEKLNGKWTGLLNQLDWSGSKIEQTTPVIIQFAYNPQAATTTYTFTINGKEVSGEAINEGTSIYFEDLYLNLNHLSFNSKIPDNIEYQFISSDFTLKKNQEKTYLTALTDSYINQWEESGAPISLVLTKNKTLTDSGEEISDEVLQALTLQESSFIKLYPNPFQSDLLIAYTLENDGFVSIEVSSIDGLQHYTVENGKQQKAGDHTYHFEGAKLKNGIYAISIVVNGLKRNKLIVKK